MNTIKRIIIRIFPSGMVTGYLEQLLSIRFSEEIVFYEVGRTFIADKVNCSGDIISKRSARLTLNTGVTNSILKFINKQIQSDRIDDECSCVVSDSGSWKMIIFYTNGKRQILEGYDVLPVNLGVELIKMRIPIGGLLVGDGDTEYYDK